MNSIKTLTSLLAMNSVRGKQYRNETMKLRASTAKYRTVGIHSKLRATPSLNITDSDKHLVGTADKMVTVCDSKHMAKLHNVLDQLISDQTEFLTNLRRTVGCQTHSLFCWHNAPAS
jgi:hypothetical protein